jgi:tRNA(adenine34) deaminase
MPFSELDEHYMRQALKLARQAFDDDEVPVGALLVYENRVLAKGWNQTERLCDVTAHAEMLALTGAAQNLGAKYLTGCTLYVTLEPCAMCAGALGWSQLARVVFAASDPKKGFSRLSGPLLHPKTTCEGGLLEEESSELLKVFFSRKRG